MRPNENIVENNTLVTLCIATDDRETMYRVAKEWNSSRPWPERVGFTIPGYGIDVPERVIEEWTEYWNTCKKLREL